MLDAGATEWRQIGFATSGDPCGLVDCEDTLISDSGTTIAFDVIDNVNPEQAWAVAASGPTLVSVTAGGAPGNGDSQVQDVTPEGRYVLFSSIATDLHGGVVTRPTGSTSETSRPARRRCSHSWSSTGSSPR